MHHYPCDYKHTRTHTVLTNDDTSVTGSSCRQLLSAELSHAHRTPGVMATNKPMMRQNDVNIMLIARSHFDFPCNRKARSHPSVFSGCQTGNVYVVSMAIRFTTALRNANHGFGDVHVVMYATPRPISLQ